MSFVPHSPDSAAIALPSKNTRRLAIDHDRRVMAVVTETFGVSALLLLAAWLALRAGAPVLAWLVAVPRGLWIQRHYCLGHESAHDKLLPGRPWANDLLGTLSLFALLTPLPVFRKIHRFHHGHNRRDLRTSALDVVWVRNNATWRRTLARIQWRLTAFGCGWFLHGLVSIALFLCLPMRVATRVSPAFRGWTPRQRWSSVVSFAGAVLIHVVALRFLGLDAWLPMFATPLLVFAWIYSAQLYIYHYDMSVGPEVTRHARSLGGPVIHWWLMGLNEHATHHRHPAVAWYALRAAGAEDGARGDGPTEPRRSFLWGIAQQWRGPRVVVRGRLP
jgi:fatty acid desaturase